MDTPEQRLTKLFDRWYNHQTSEAEEQELMDLLKASDEQEKLDELIKGAYDQLKEGHFFTNEQKTKMSDAILGTKKIPLRIFAFRRIAAAAAIIIVLGAGTFLWFNQNSKSEIAKVDVPVVNDIPAPVRTRAMITLADGRQLPLDSVKNGTLANVDDVKIQKLADGQIAYSGTARQLQYNTLTNLRGSKVVNLTLSDGTKVWLNSESSLRYPTAFVTGERKVEITGEAYFEAAHNDVMPFVVQNGDMRVTVLGTHFNVNTYNDEDNIKVTLLEGKVQVNKGISSKLLVPGQQAQVNSNAQIILHKDVDTEQVMAWKKGLFSFKGSDIKTVMLQLARWYDVDVIFEGNKTSEHFVSTIPRDLPALQVFKILETTGKVHFKIEGKKITVMP